MKKLKKTLAMLLVMLMISTVVPFSAFADVLVMGDYTGKTVILHTNDVHGSILNYAKVATLEEEYENKGAEVILVDAGDFSQGSVYVSDSKGKSAVDMMNAVGYDYSTVGNHEFDYGYDTLKSNLEKASFDVLAANIFDKNNQLLFDDSDVYTTSSGVKIGFVGLSTPQTRTECNPKYVKDFTFLSNQALYDCATNEATELREAGADVVVAISHLGVADDAIPNCSYNVYNNSKGIDFMVDAHSHTKMTEGPSGEPIQSTGEHLDNIGVIVIDNKSAEIESNKLVPTADIKDNQKIYEQANKIVQEVDEKYAETFAVSKVDLNGARNPGNRTEETNLGDLIADSLIYSVIKDGNSLDVPDENIVAIENGGGVRASISAGDISKNDVLKVLPFGNVVNVIYVDGATLLRVLETSTQTTPSEMGAFPQVSGMNITIDTTKEYDQADEPFPGTSVYGCKSINRVKINSVNGRKFDPNAKYAVITNDFLASGGDTYYELAESPIKIDIGVPLDEATMDYIANKLDGVIGEQYANPQKRVTVMTKDNYIDVQMLESPKDTVEVGSKTELMFRSNAEFNDFIEFRINGVAIDASNYTVKAGSTIVTLSADYVSALAKGTYEAEIVSAKGVASANFEIVDSSSKKDDDNKDDDKKSPDTGDEAFICALGMLFVTAGGVLIIIRKKIDA